MNLRSSYPLLVLTLSLCAACIGTSTGNPLDPDGGAAFDAQAFDSSPGFDGAAADAGASDDGGPASDASSDGGAIDGGDPCTSMFGACGTVAAAGCDCLAGEAQIARRDEGALSQSVLELADRTGGAMVVRAREGDVPLELLNLGEDFLPVGEPVELPGRGGVSVQDDDAVHLVLINENTLSGTSIQKADGSISEPQELIVADSRPELLATALQAGTQAVAFLGRNTIHFFLVGEGTLVVETPVVDVSVRRMALAPGNDGWLLAYSTADAIFAVQLGPTGEPTAPAVEIAASVASTVYVPPLYAQPLADGWVIGSDFGIVRVDEDLAEVASAALPGTMAALQTDGDTTIAVMGASCLADSVPLAVHRFDASLVPLHASVQIGSGGYSSSAAVGLFGERVRVAFSDASDPDGAFVATADVCVTP